LLQQDVYESTTKFLIGNVINGYNATVFAYGATGNCFISIKKMREKKKYRDEKNVFFPFLKVLKSLNAKLCNTFL
jgi:hypothetical protein